MVINAAVPSSRRDLSVNGGAMKYAAWLEVSETGGTNTVLFVGRVASVRNIRQFELSDGAVSFSENEYFSPYEKCVHRFAFDGDRVTGTITRPNCTVLAVTGQRAPKLDRPAPAKWSEPKALFTGRDFSGWQAIYGSLPPSNWRIEHGELITFKSGTPLRTAEVFDDFKLHVEFNCPTNANSGIYLRGRYEVQFEDDSIKAPPNQGHVQMQITGLCLDRSGREPRLRVVGQNEGLDSSVYDLEGNLLWMYQLKNGGSSTVAADGKFIFEGSGGNWNGSTLLERLDAAITSPNPSAARNQVPGLSGKLKHITGLAAGSGRVYVAEGYAERVIVLDAASLAEVASFRAPRAGRIVLDGKGGLWVGQRPGTAPETPQIPAADGKPGVDGTSLESRPDGKPPDHEHPGKIHYFTVDGKQVTDRTITLDSVVEPGHMAIHPLNGQLYVGGKVEVSATGQDGPWTQVTAIGFEPHGWPNTYVT